MKYEIKNRWNGKVIFTAEIDAKESDSYAVKLGLAVKVAVKEKADLSGADLCRASLRVADLFVANLRGASLRGASLRGADLSGADLSGADLSGADIRGASFRGAYLRGVKAYGYKFNRAPIMMSTERYQVEIWEGFMKIGCEKRTIAEWSKITEDDVEEMEDENAAKLWKSWKKPLLAIAKADGRMKLPEQGE